MTFMELTGRLSTCIIYRLRQLFPETTGVVLILSRIIPQSYLNPVTHFFMPY